MVSDTSLVLTNVLLVIVLLLFGIILHTFHIEYVCSFVIREPLDTSLVNEEESDEWI